MKNIIYYLVLSLLLVPLSSCEKETLPDARVCEEEHFYYSAGSKILLQHSLSETWIEFKQTGVTKEVAETILGSYPFINTDFASKINNRGVWVKINGKPDCTTFKNHLRELNQNDAIFSATPLFYPSDGKSGFHMILLSEVLTKHNPSSVSEAEFIEYAETFDLELIASKNWTQRFRVKEVVTGFEALEKGNLIYEGAKAEYSHPNFMADISQLR